MRGCEIERAHERPVDRPAAGPFHGIAWQIAESAERGLSDKQVSLALTIASLVSMPLVFGSGRLLDALGRRRGAVVIFLAGALGIFGAYSAHSHLLLTVALAFGMVTRMPSRVS